jgi:hypothetical protein
VVRGIGRLRLATVGILATAGLGGLAAQASAVTFCVQDPGCTGDARTTIGQAIADAGANGAGRDRIQVGPGDFPEVNLNADGNNLVDIVGAGRDRTRIVPGPATNGFTLQIGHTGSNVTDLEVRTPSGGSGNTGLFSRGTAERVTVTGSVANDEGVHMDNAGTFRDGSVALTGAGSTGIGGTNGLVERVTVTAQGTGVTGVERIAGSRITAPVGAGTGPIAPAQTFEDTVIRVPPGTTDGVAISITGTLFPATLTARNLTLVGGGANSTGVAVSATGGGFVASQASATLDGVVLRGFATDLRRTANGGPQPPDDAAANVSIDHSNYDPAKVAGANNSVAGGGDASGTITDGGHNVTGDPRFRDEAGGDFRPRGSSVLIDRGNAAAAQPPADLAGAPRIVDGNGDGAPVVDIGAFEYQRGAPTASASAAPASVVVGQPVGFMGAASDPQGDALSAAWSFGDGATGSGLAASHAYAAPGNYTATLTVANEGNATATAAVVVVVSAVRAAVSGVSVTNAVFTWGSGPTAISSAVRRRPRPRGTTFGFRLSQAAAVRIALQRKLPGRRVGRRCARPTFALRRRARCTRYVPAGALTRRNRAAGLNQVAFSGRLARRRLPAGSYRAALTATAFRLTSLPRYVSFRIVTP